MRKIVKLMAKSRYIWCKVWYTVLYIFICSYVESEIFEYIRRFIVFELCWFWSKATIHSSFDHILYLLQCWNQQQKNALSRIYTQSDRETQTLNKWREEQQMYTRIYVAFVTQLDGCRWIRNKKVKPKRNRQQNRRIVYIVSRSIFWVGIRDVNKVVFWFFKWLNNRQTIACSVLFSTSSLIF